MASMIAYEDRMRAGGSAALEETERFFMKEDAVHQALRAIVPKLDELGIPYAVVGGMALTVYGYKRATVDVDILVTRESNRLIHEKLDGLGYVPPFTGSRNLRDTANGVRIEFLITGEFPGDGKPKPIAFPDPAGPAVVVDGIRYLKLSRFIELKLASGMTNPGRLKDLADIQELIKLIKLPRSLAGELDGYVRSKYTELWDAAQNEPAEQ
jgi:hypothetical protein